VPTPLNIQMHPGIVESPRVTPGDPRGALRVEIEMNSGEARNYGRLGAKDGLAQ
jgi:hypothetical protein